MIDQTENRIEKKIQEMKDGFFFTETRILQAIEKLSKAK